MIAHELGHFDPGHPDHVLAGEIRLLTDSVLEEEADAYAASCMGTTDHLKPWQRW